MFHEESLNAMLKIYKHYVSDYFDDSLQIILVKNDNMFKFNLIMYSKGIIYYLEKYNKFSL